MTLGRLVLAWLPVAVWFTCATGITRRLAFAGETAPSLGSFFLRTARRSLLEGLFLTLLASLWFDTLGAGAWWLPAALVGALAGIAGVTPILPAVAHARRTVVLLFLVDVLRYVGAGVLLMWRLG